MPIYGILIQINQYDNMVRPQSAIVNRNRIGNRPGALCQTMFYVELNIKHGWVVSDLLS